jgi:hypothetical protein
MACLSSFHLGHENKKCGTVFWYTDGGEGLGDIRHVRTGLSCQLGAAIMLWSLGKILTQIVILTAATLFIDITQHRCLNLYLLDKVHCHPS